jgi:hypothetical protein
MVAGSLTRTASLDPVRADLLALDLHDQRRPGDDRRRRNDDHEAARRARPRRSPVVVGLGGFDTALG